MGLLCFIFGHKWSYGSSHAELDGKPGAFIPIKTRLCKRCENYQFKISILGYMFSNPHNNKWQTPKKDKKKKPRKLKRLYKR